MSDVTSTGVGGGFMRAPARDPEISLSRAIGRAKTGDRSAVHFLYLRYADDVYRYVYRLIGDRHEAEDITQTVFAKLLTALPSYERSEAPFTAWILRVARNAAIDGMRARRPVPCAEINADGLSDDRSGPERLRSLREALSRLPTDQRQVVGLRHIVGLSPGEIAERLTRSEASIHAIHHRGRAALRETLLELEAGPVTAMG